MKVLLTRPQGRNQAMVQALQSKGIEYIVTPLLHIAPIQTLPSECETQLFLHADIIIFISTNAVKFAAQSLQGLWPDQAQFIAVGDASFEALTRLGIQAQTAPSDCQQTEGLLRLDALQHIQDKKIVIVRGDGGRETLAESLTIRGAKVSYWQVYHRTSPPLAPVIVTQWQDAKLDTIIVTSGEILDNLVKLVPKELFAWLQACHIIVPSSRVQQQALAYGLTHVTNAKAANSVASLAALGFS